MLLAISAACGRPAREGPAVGGRAELESVVVGETCPPERADTSILSSLDLGYSHGDPAQRLDIAWPGLGTHPMVVLLHGGGWTGGDKADMRGEMRAIAREGYVVASVGYRLVQGTRNRFPAAVEDVRCALGWLRRNAHLFGGDPEHAVLMGHSAGGYLASLVGAGDPGAIAAPCGVDAPPLRIRGVVSHGGPQDLRLRGPYTREQAEHVTTFLGVFPGADPALATRASPIVRVSASSPPFLLLHGARDRLVPIAQARAMRDALRSAGVRATLLELPRKGHPFPGFLTNARKAARCTVLGFLASATR